MKTLIVSDLHLGSASGADVLRAPHARERLLSALSGVERLVMLGDVLELRHGPRRDALAVAAPVFEQIGAAMAGGQIVLVAGNHDHALVDRWLHRRSEQQQPSALQLEHRIAPAEASAMAQRLAELAAPAQVEVAYPGLWIRDDVYATHGHYLDCHITVPTMERIAVALMGRLLTRRPQAISCVDDYEAVTSPIYAWADAVAAQGATRSALNGAATVKMWRLLHGRSHAPGAHEERSSPNGAGAEERRAMLSGGIGAGLRSGAVRRGFPFAVAALNRMGLGPLKPNISASELRRAGLQAMGQVAARLDLGEAHVVFGHTHRAGPLAGDEQAEWRSESGARLINCGSWIYNAGFLHPSASENPYWPGSCVLVDDAELLRAPQLMRLLAGSRQAQLVPS
jgi:UDP-2,3-diacylglucosamine pyrophosphatase LpxH